MLLFLTRLLESNKTPEVDTWHMYDLLVHCRFLRTGEHNAARKVELRVLEAAGDAGVTEACRPEAAAAAAAAKRYQLRLRHLLFAARTQGRRIGGEFGAADTLILCTRIRSQINSAYVGEIPGITCQVALSQN